MHTLAVHLAPILAAEKGKAPFFIAGGLLVAWALFVSLAMGMRNPKFPGNLGGQRVVSAITALLVIAAASTAVITSGGEEKAGAESKPTYTQFGANTPDTAAPESANKAPAASGGSTAPTEPTPPASTPTASTPAKTTPAKKAPAKKSPAKKETPKATTGTPAPPSSPAAVATTLKLAANPAGQLAYTSKQLSAKAGKVTVDFTNASPVEHDVAFAQGSTVAGQTPVFTGGSKTLTITLKPGTYTFYCTVPGHRAAGMEGTLTVS